MADESGAIGMLDVAGLRAAVDEGAIDTVILAFADLYGRLLGKRLDASFFLSDVVGGTHVCDYLFTADMEMEPVAGYEFSNWELGYGDMHLVPDLGTLRLVAWLDRSALVMCDAEVEKPGDGAHEAVAVAPRTMLRRQVERLRGLGLEAMAGSELEYYQFRTSYEEASAGGYRDLRETGWYIEDYHLLQGARTEDLNGAFRRGLAGSGVPVESTKGEFGRAQHELNIRYAPVLEMADRHLLVKQAVKEISDAAGASATFMAKPDAAQAGSSSHLHVSLWRGETNAFAGDGDLAGVACSDEFRWFLGGWMRYAAELMVCYAPTVNSYKRFEAGSWAPTALAWSPDNRTAGFRVVGAGSSLRIECRIPGADVNPYLAYSAALASGLAGIEERIEPPDAYLGDVYSASEVAGLPGTLEEGVELFEGSEPARSAFGAAVVAHYAHFFSTEAEAFRRAVTDWERVRYFERI